MPLVILSGCTAQFMSDQVGNPEDRFSHNEAHFNLSRVYHSVGRKQKILKKKMWPIAYKQNLACL